MALPPIPWAALRLTRRLLLLRGFTAMVADSNTWRPYSQQFASIEKSRLLGCAMLLPDNQYALVSKTVLGSRRSVNLRHCRGFVNQAQWLRTDDQSGVALLKLNRPFPAASSTAHDISLDTKVPFAGSLAYRLYFDSKSTQQLSWPSLRASFIERGSTVSVPGDATAIVSSLLLNRRGQLIGLINSSANNAPVKLLTLASCSDLFDSTGIVMPKPDRSGDSPVGSTAIDSVYQSGLNAVLQVIA
jgi:hypothetical protein